MVEKTYRCDLCRSPEVNNKYAVLIPFEYNGQYRVRKPINPIDCNHHICMSCLHGLRELAKEYGPNLNELFNERTDENQ